VPARRSSQAASRDVVQRVVRWYFRTTLPASFGLAALPFYCDPARVGSFAVSPAELSRGDEAALFRLFIGLAMFQARRDVVIMAQQRTLRRPIVRQLTSLAALSVAVRRSDCTFLGSADALADCSVRKIHSQVDCTTHRGAQCHVKEATAAFNRMSDMGKLPSSAWLQVWADGGLERTLQQVFAATSVPTLRGQLLVAKFGRVHRVGEKLAAMFVSALSTPALAPGLTPWYPGVDGNELVVVDTHVARAADALRPVGAPRTYRARAQWVRSIAETIDLRAFRRELPRYSPRIVQEALYSFCSRSNRVAKADPCALAPAPCRACAPQLCPFVRRT
jgi:hypothetical protein